MVENLGKFSRIVPAGLVCIMCPLESVVGRVSLRVQQLDVPCETKTKARIPVASARHAGDPASQVECLVHAAEQAAAAASSDASSCSAPP